ncbi:GNAT family N-acetyltransferase [Methylomonas sp. CM2]|uniref:GNAT family N-acetyltransferase n=1 Tax=Methylomonas sp. CM2 TaxID=3417647 RepID=UPI003CEC9BA1
MLSPPTLLTVEHRRHDFACGVDALDDWLKRRALSNQFSGALRTYVVTDESRIVGYYCLASGAMVLNHAPPALKRNMPDPVPMAILGRLAVDFAWRGRGLGVALLQDAVLRTLRAASIVGIRGLLVHALSEPAKAFYQHHGFVASPTQPMTLILSLKHPLNSATTEASADQQSIKDGPA